MSGTARSNRDGANDNESWNCGYEGFVDKLHAT